MSTHDYVIANQNGANTRSDLNNAFSAIVSNNSSASEPSTTYAYMWWADTTNDLLKQRNAADSAWISILTLSTGAVSNATVADDSITLAKMAGGTDGELITYDTSGDPTTVPTGTSGQVLTSNGAGTTPTFQAAAGGGKLKKVATVQSRTISTYSVPTSGDGTELSPVTLTMTPTTAGNTVILKWIIQGDCYTDAVFLVTRNGTKLTDTTDASNNKWAGIVNFPYDPDAGSTPNSVSITIMDNSCLNTSSVYRLLVRSSSSTARTFYFNRPQDSAGGSSQENGLCSCVAMEVEV